MRFKDPKNIEIDGKKYQVLISTGDKPYRIYRGLEGATSAHGISPVWVSRRAPSGERLVRPKFFVKDRSTLAAIVLVNEIKMLFRFLPNAVSVTTVKHILREMAEHYSSIRGHESKPWCRIDSAQMVDKTLFSNDAANRLQAAAQALGVYIER